jgi:hypothetical protein
MTARKAPEAPETEEPTPVEDPFAGEIVPDQVLPTDPEPKTKKHPALPATYHSKDGEYLVNIARPWGPVVVSVIPRGWHGAPPLQLPLEDLEGLVGALGEALKKHKGQG